MTPTKSYTHCQAAHTAHNPSEAKSVLSAECAEKVLKEKCPTARPNIKSRVTLTEDKRKGYD